MVLYISLELLHGIQFRPQSNFCLLILYREKVVLSNTIQPPSFDLDCTVQNCLKKKALFFSQYNNLHNMNFQHKKKDTLFYEL